MVGVKFLDYSEVAGLEEVFLPVQLLFELVQVLLLEGIDRAQHVPIDGGGTGWSGDGAAVYPAVLHVDHVKKFAVGDLWHFGIGVSL